MTTALEWRTEYGPKIDQILANQATIIGNEQAILSTLAQLLAGQQGGTGGASSLVLGSAHSPATEDAWTALLATLGLADGAMARHTYCDSIPSSYSACAAGTDAGKRPSIIGVRYDVDQANAGTLDGAMTAFVGTCPPGTRIILFWEPDASHGTQWTPLQHVQAMDRFARLIFNVRGDILVGLCFTGWLFDPGNHSGALAAWTQAILDVDPDFAFVSVDAYQRYNFPPAGKPQTWDPAPTPQMAAHATWCDQYSFIPAIAETACGVGPNGVADKVAWMQALADWCDQQGHAFLCWFDSSVNNDIDPTSLLEAQPESIATWAQLVGAHSGSK